MDTKIDFEKVKEMVKNNKPLKEICKHFKVSELYYYRTMTDEQLNELKSIRNKYTYDLDARVIYAKFLEGLSVADLAHEYRVSKSTINLTIDRGLDIYRQESKKVTEIEYFEATDPIKKYRHELINFILSPEGISIPKDKLIRMIQEIKNLDKFINSR